VHPAVSHDLAKAHIDDLHRRARRHTLARADRRTGPDHRSHPALWLPTLTRRVLAVLRAGTGDDRGRARPAFVARPAARTERNR